MLHALVGTLVIAKLAAIGGSSRTRAWRCSPTSAALSSLSEATPDRTFRASAELGGVYLVGVMRAAAREVRDIARGRTSTHARLRDTFVSVVVTTVGVDLACAVLALMFDRHAKQTQITSFGSALFWTTTQLLTVSSSFQNPISAGGRVLDVGMEIYAITVIATLAGSFGAFMVKRGRELEDATTAANNS